MLACYYKSLVVKRIVGLPGEEGEVKKGALFIEGSLEKEKHPIKQGSLSLWPIANSSRQNGSLITLWQSPFSRRVLIHPKLVYPDRQDYGENQSADDRGPREIIILVTSRGRVRTSS